MSRSLSSGARSRDPMAHGGLRCREPELELCARVESASVRGLTAHTQSKHVADRTWINRNQCKMPIWVSAALWGLLGASSLILGAAVAFLVSLPMRLTAGIMACGCRVLISAVAYDLLEDGFQEGGIFAIVAGAIAGSLAYTVADWWVCR